MFIFTNIVVLGAVATLGAPMSSVGFPTPCRTASLDDCAQSMVFKVGVGTLFVGLPTLYSDA